MIFAILFYCDEDDAATTHAISWLIFHSDARTAQSPFKKKKQSKPNKATATKKAAETGSMICRDSAQPF
jgi:hypothetical protein